MLTTLKCPIPFVSVLVKKDVCIFTVMAHAHPETGKDQVRGLRKLNAFRLALSRNLDPKVFKELIEAIWNC